MAHHDSSGTHHHHRRKRIHLKHEPYPHPDKWKRFLDKAIYAIILIGPIMTIPQIIKIWVWHTAEGVSFISWTTYMFTASFWFMYGIAHRERPIMFSAAIWIVLDLIIIIGIFIYGTNLF